MELFARPAYKLEQKHGKTKRVDEKVGGIVVICTTGEMFGFGKVLWDQVVMREVAAGCNRLLRKIFNMGNFLIQEGII